MTNIETMRTTNKPPKYPKHRESWRQYAERRGVSTRTLDRWVAAGILPEPDRINGRKYIDPKIEPRADAI